MIFTLLYLIKQARTSTCKDMLSVMILVCGIRIFVNDKGYRECGAVCTHLIVIISDSTKNRRVNNAIMCWEQRKISLKKDQYIIVSTT
jgi:hypothetical protein